MKRLLLLLITCSLFAPSPAAAQPQCGFARSIAYPVDTSRFQLAQDFGALSPRHQGRYHTGEDWYSGREDNFGLGAPVHAAADGRVTYASPIGWGRDGGVIIIEHTFPDGTILYSQYGHMEQTDSARFPAQWSCVRQGDIIGAIGNVRPAPHLHFEIRVRDGTAPGPGYSWENPIRAGWRQPAKLVANWQVWLQPAYRWRLDLADETGPITPPLPLDDESLLYLDANRLGRVSPDGRSLWRINLERQAVGLTLADARPVIIYADGSMQRVNLDGTLAERWETGIPFDSAPLTIGDSILLHTADGALVAFGSDRQQIAWRVDESAVPLRAQSAGGLLGLLMSDHQLLTLSASGQPIDSAQLRGPGGLAASVDDHLLALTVGGLWTISPEGIWDVYIEGLRAENGSGALVRTADGSLHVFDGRVLHVYDVTRALRWQVEIPGVSGLATLSTYDGVLLLTSSHGDLIAIQQSSGGLCGRARVYGSDRARFWHRLGADGILRVAVSDQILGLDWRQFLGGCA